MPPIAIYGVRTGDFLKCSPPDLMTHWGMSDSNECAEIINIELNFHKRIIIAHMYHIHKGGARLLHGQPHIDNRSKSLNDHTNLVYQEMTSSSTSHGCGAIMRKTTPSPAAAVPRNRP